MEILVNKRKFVVRSYASNKDYISSNELIFVTLEGAVPKELVYIIIKYCQDDADVCTFLRKYKVQLEQRKWKLYRKGISDKDCRAIAHVLWNNESLQVLDLRVNDIGNIGAEAIFESLKSNSKLKRLYISNRIDDLGATNMGDCLKLNSTLTYLDVCANNISDHGATYIAKCLERNSFLKHIHLSGNVISNVGADALGASLLINSVLVSIKLHHILQIQKLRTMCDVCYLQSDKNDIDAILIASILVTNHTLREVKLNGNNIGDQGATCLAKALENNSTIVWLSLSSNLITDKGTSAIAIFLKINQTLQTLVLERNKIGDEGAEAIGKALKSNRTLRCLNLGNNKIGKTGAKEIAESLQRHPGLKKLYLETNKLDDMAAFAIADMIRDRKSVV